MKIYTIIAGANGVGKTSLYQILKSSDDFESDNPWNESGFVGRLPVFSNNSLSAEN